MAVVRRVGSSRVDPLTGTRENLGHEGRSSRVARIEADQRDMSAMNERLHRLDVKVSSLWVVIIIGLLTKFQLKGASKARKEESSDQTGTPPH